MVDAWKTRRDEVLESAGSVVEAIEYNENFAGRAGSLSLDIVEQMVSSAIESSIATTEALGHSPSLLIPSVSICCSTWRGGEAMSPLARRPR